MEMAQFDDWLDGINVRLASASGSASNIPRVIVVHTVRSIVKTFLEKTNIWTHYPKNTAMQTGWRVLTIPRDTYVCKLWGIDCNPCLSDKLVYKHPNIIDMTMLSASDIKNETLEGLKVSLSVTQNSLECPMFVFDRYYDLIINGALANLQAMPGKVWSEPSMVEYHRSLFESLLLEAQADANSNMNTKRQNTNIPPTFM